MTLRTKALIASGIFYYGPGVALVVFWGNLIGIALSVGWLAWGGRRLLRRIILPTLFPHTMCAHCKTWINLKKRRWGCGGHYNDPNAHPIWDFHCNDGHILKSITCTNPECRATLPIQWPIGVIGKKGIALDEFEELSTRRERRRDLDRVDL